MPLPDGARFILERLDAAGFEGFAVGGCVRDALLGLQPKDYDICTNAQPQEMQRIFADCRVIETGLQHGTLTVLRDGEPYEVTTYRIDGDYADHRHPDKVTFTRSLDADLARRDFTVNAIAYNPRHGLIDLFEGQKDLQKKLIRCVGEAQRRFDEDALRILRALRFAAVYGFAIEEETAQAAHLLKSTLKHVARERITVELSKLLCGAGAQEILLRHGAVIAEVLPAALHAEATAQAPAQLPIRLAHLLQDAQDVKAALGALRLDNATAKAAMELIALKDRLEPENAVQWRKLLHETGQERTQQLAAWKQWNVQPLQDILARGDCWNLKMLAVTGKDLMAAGFAPGRGIGQTLESLLLAVMEERVENQRAALMDFAQRMREKALC